MSLALRSTPTPWWSHANSDHRAAEVSRARVHLKPTAHGQCNRCKIGVVDVDELLGGASAAAVFNGVVFLRRGNAVLLDRAYGFADREQAVLNTRATRFQIASLSKQFAAAAVLLLQEQAMLSVSESPAKWLRGAPPEWAGITIHHLLTHTSGLGHWHDYDVDLFTPIARDQLLEAFADRPLHSPPGERWYYSSPGFIVIAAIVEEVAEMAYAEFLEASIFLPLGMDSTVAGNTDRGGAKARGYGGGEPLRSFDLDTVNIGAGDICSTARDLDRWLAALRAGSLLTEASTTTMFTRHSPIPPETVATMFGELAGGSEHQHGCGYGWFIGALHERRTIYHPGDNEGFKAWSAWLPDHGLAIVVLSNEEQVNTEAAGLSLIELALAPAA
jgi:CubicO group peptidase (beta-lactamase class C family)